MLMEGQTSCEWQKMRQLEIVKSELDSLSRENECKSDNAVVALSSYDTILPDDILEKIFSFLPVESIIRAGSICKRWHEVVHSKKHSWNNMSMHKPWYFMFTYSKSIKGYAYDTSFRKWYNFDFPCLDKSNWFVSSSYGLVCLMDYENRNRIFICNPITRDWKQLQQPLGGKSSDYSALALSVNKFSLCYTVAIVKSKELPGDFLQWDFTIQIYKSENHLWVALANEVLVGWRGGNESVICDGILYCLVYSFSGNNDRRHGIIMGKLVMVGGIGRYDRPDIIKGIGIWELNKEKWQEVSRLPHKFFQGFGELDDVFASSGVEDLIFIQSYGAPLLLIFDMNQKQWKWSMRCPVTKTFTLQLFTGFCFDPRLDITL